MIYMSRSLDWARLVYPRLTYPQLEYLAGLMEELIPSASVQYHMPDFDIRQGEWMWPFFRVGGDAVASNADAPPTRQVELPLTCEEYDCWLELAETQTAAKYSLPLSAFES